MQPPAPWSPPVPLPMPIETARCLLRWFEADDAQALHEAIDPHRAHLLPWLPWAADDHETVAASRSRISWLGGLRSGPEVKIPDYTMGIFEAATGVLLGGTGLHRIVPGALDAEVGYWLRADRCGEGFCTEATAALITAAFGPWGFRRVRLVCSAANTASRKVPERLGIRLEGCERESRWVEGHGWTDTLTFGVLAEEWDAARQCVAKSAD
jgi:RimJ/RimL family protein N-acetyltransferase